MAPRTSGLLWPTLFAIPALAVLLGLGTWQLQRKAWKDGLVAQIAARTTSAPVPLAEALARYARGEHPEYLRVSVEGRWLPSPEVHLWMPTAAGPGWHVYAALETAAGAAPSRPLVVNRGFVPDSRRDPKTRPEPASAGPVAFVGLLRAPEIKGTFTPENDAARNVWYWRDLSAMAGAMHLDGRSLVPFFVDAERGATMPPGPEGGSTRLEIPNRHLEYAVTWFGLAATLIGVYAAFAWGRIKHGRGGPRQQPEV